MDGLTPGGGGGGDGRCSRACSASCGAEEYWRIIIHVRLTLLYFDALRESLRSAVLRHCCAIRWVIDEQQQRGKQRKSSFFEFSSRRMDDLSHSTPSSLNRNNPNPHVVARTAGSDGSERPLRLR